MGRWYKCDFVALQPISQFKKIEDWKMKWMWLWDKCDFVGLQQISQFKKKIIIKIEDSEPPLFLHCRHLFVIFRVLLSLQVLFVSPVIQFNYPVWDWVWSFFDQRAYLLEIALIAVSI